MLYFTAGWWGESVEKASKRRERLPLEMQKLRRVLGLYFCRSDSMSPTSCHLHCRWGELLVSHMQDLDSAAAFFKFGSDNGHARSTYRYARCLLFGQGCVPDARRAKQLLDHLEAAGCTHIACTYYRCQAALILPDRGQTGCVRRTKETIVKLIKAVSRGIKDHTSDAWDRTLGVSPETTHQCFAGAHFLLGELYLCARFVVRSIDRAHLHMREAAKLGNVEALRRIGDMFGYGCGSKIRQDRKLAKRYYALAAQNGSVKGNRRLHHLDDLARASVV